MKDIIARAEELLRTAGAPVPNATWVEIVRELLDLLCVPGVAPSAAEIELGELSHIALQMSDPQHHLEGCHAPSLRTTLLRTLITARLHRKIVGVWAKRCVEFRAERELAIALMTAAGVKPVPEDCDGKLVGQIELMRQMWQADREALKTLREAMEKV